MICSHQIVYNIKIGEADKVLAEATAGFFLRQFGFSKTQQTELAEEGGLLGRMSGKDKGKGAE